MPKNLTAIFGHGLQTTHTTTMKHGKIGVRNQKTLVCVDNKSYQFMPGVYGKHAWSSRGVAENHFLPAIVAHMANALGMDKPYYTLYDKMRDDRMWCVYETGGYDCTDIGDPMYNNPVFSAHHTIIGEMWVIEITGFKNAKVRKYVLRHIDEVYAATIKKLAPLN